MLITQEEMDILREEVFTRAINIAKVSYKEQYEDGYIESYVATKLTYLGDSVLEHPGRYIKFEDVKKQLTISRFYYNMQKWLDCYLSKLHDNKLAIDWKYAYGRDQEVNLLYDGKRNVFRRMASTIVAHPQFETVSFIRIIVGICSLIIINVFVYIDSNYTATMNIITLDRIMGKTLYTVETLLHAIYDLWFLTEMILKMVAVGPKVYWRSFSNKLDVTILTISVLCITYFTAEVFATSNSDVGMFHGILLITPSLSCLHLFFNSMVIIRKFCVNTYNDQLYKNYSFSKGFEIGQKFVLRKLHQITDYKDVINYLQDVIDSNISQIMQEMATLFQVHPEIVVASTTHLVSRKIIETAITDMSWKKNTVLHEADYEALFQVLHCMKLKVMKAPSSISTSLRCVDIVCANSWVDRRMYKHLQEHLILETHAPGTILQENGTLTKGVYIIMSGVVKVTGLPDAYKSDVLPSASSLLYLAAQPNEKFIDYLIVTQTLGLLGVLTRSPLLTDAVCLTLVETILIPTEKIYRVIEERCERPSLLYSAWRYVSLRVAFPVLVQLIQYSATSLSDIRLMLSESILPNFENCTEFRRTDNIIDIILIQGVVEDGRTNMHYYGPAYIPRSVTMLRFLPKENRASRLIVLLLTNEYYELPEELDWAGTVTDKTFARISRNQQSKKQSTSTEGEALPAVTPEAESEDAAGRELQLYECFDDSFMHAPRLSADALTMFKYEALEKEMTLRS